MFAPQSETIAVNKTQTKDIKNFLDNIFPILILSIILTIFAKKCQIILINLK